MSQLELKGRTGSLLESSNIASTAALTLLIIDMYILRLFLFNTSKYVLLFLLRFYFYFLPQYVHMYLKIDIYFAKKRILIY